jgi:hypothetical protein
VLEQLLKPLPALVAALLAVRLALAYLDHGIGVPLALIGSLLVVTGVLFGVGRAIFGNKPYTGGLLMESGLLLIVWGAAIAGAVLVWYAIDQAPPATADAREKAVFAAVSAALAAYLGSVIIKPDGELWNPVKSAIKNVFETSFTAPATALERDARNAIQTDRYGAEAHSDNVVSGWGWSDRRKRTHHIQDQLEA